MAQHFYHQLTTKYIAAFGSLFNDIKLIRYNKAHTSEIRRVTVPLVHSPREKYLVRNLADPDLQKQVQATYPIMAYEMQGLEYDAARQQNPLNQIPKANTVDGNADTIYQGVPYNIGFNLSIIARNKDDAWQIAEQILPLFHPSYTFSSILIPEIGFVKDIPLILNQVTPIIEYGEDFGEINTVEIQLNFTMKVYFYGPVSKSYIIKRVFANTFLDHNLSAGSIVRVNVNSGNNGDYYLDDLVYQGNTVTEVTAAGYVTKWDNVNRYLVIGGIQGQFTTNNYIQAVSSNAKYNLASFDISPLKVESLKTEPDPITANTSDDYGYTHTLVEYPDTLL